MSLLKFDVKKVIITKNEIKVEKNVVEAIKKVADISYKMYPLKKIVWIKIDDLCVISQNPKGRSIYAKLVSKNIIGIYRVGWIVKDKKGKREWVAKYFLRPNREKNIFELEIYKPGSKIPGLDDRK